MPDDADTLTPADPRDLAEAIAFAMRFNDLVLSMRGRAEGPFPGTEK